MKSYNPFKMPLTWIGLGVAVAFVVIAMMFNKSISTGYSFIEGLKFVGIYGTAWFLIGWGINSLWRKFK